MDWAHDWWECVLPPVDGPETSAHCDVCGRDWVRSLEGGWRNVQEGTVQGQ